MKLLPVLCVLAYVNDVSAFIPSLWAQESLMILENTLVMGNLVHRDFEPVIQDFGDTVNTRRPQKFAAVRKTVNDPITIQDAIAVNVAVKLDQHWHTSFIIKDSDQTKSFKDLAITYLQPAVISIAEQIDAVICGQTYQFLANAMGKLGVSPDYTLVVDVKEKLNALLVPLAGRNCILPPSLEGSLLKDINFVNADRIGDNGSALREGSVGRKYGLDFYMGQQMPSVPVGSSTVVGAINGGLLAAGSTTITVNGFAAAIINGSWFTVGGVPYRVVSTVGGATPTSITIAAPGLRDAIVNLAVVTVYTPAAVNFGGGYATGYQKNLTINGLTVAPRTQQLLSTPSGEVFSVVTAGATITNIPFLDRPIVTALANADVIGVGPTGSFGLAFHKNCVALVTRPLATARPGIGAMSYVASYKNLSIRVTMTYDAVNQGTLVTVDMLGGVKVLDTNLAVPIMGN